MEDQSVTPVVSTEWLHQQIRARNPKIRVLDATWYSTKDARKEYKERHLLQAAYFDIYEGVTNTELRPRNIPDADTFEKQACSLGIDQDTHVVVYDAEGQCGFFIAGRAWFIFKLYGHKRVSVLNGGMQKWIADGYALTAGIPNFKEGNFKAKYDPTYITDHENMSKNFTEKHLQVLDSRATPVYVGNEEQTLSGHYPGAISIPMAAKLFDDEKKKMKSAEELKQVFSGSGVDLDRPFVTMCNSGMSSCSLLLAAQILGKHGALYHGGMTEWGKLEGPDKIQKGGSSQ